MVKNPYKVYIAGVRLPVNPEDVKTDEGVNTFEYNVIELGDIIIPGTPKLRKYTMKSFLPVDTERYGCREPGYYVDLFEGLMEAKAPVELIIARYLPDGTPHIQTNTQAVLTDFEYEDEFGHNDVPYTIKLTEYREIPVRVLTL